MQNAMKWLMFLIAINIVSCKKDENEEGTSTVNVNLTDAPAGYDSVLVDIQGVAITGNSGNEVNLNIITPGIYNLLDFTNGVDTLIATGVISSGKVSQIRLILGNNNRIVVDSVSHPLSTPSAQQSGLKIQVHREFLVNTTYNLLLDFDAQASIVEEGNGSYSLKPVINLSDLH